MRERTQEGRIEATFYREFGILLRRKRCQRGWSQQELATEIGVHRNTIARWEAGGEKVNIFMLLRAADILGCQHLLLLPARSFVWGEDLQRLLHERDPHFFGGKKVQAERDPAISDCERLA